MKFKIDSFQIVENLNKGDIIFQDENEKYRVTLIADTYLMAIHTGAFARVRIFSLADLIKYNWWLDRSGFPVHIMPN
jgi:hypothetical protein